MKFLKNFLAKSVLSRTTVLLLDVLMLTVSVVIAYLLWFKYEVIGASIGQMSILLVLLLFFNIVTFFFFKTFSGILRFSSFEDLLKIFYALTIGYGITYLFVQVLSFSHTTFQISIQVFILAYIMNAVLMVFSRVIIKETYDLLTSQYRDSYNVFIYGTKLPGIRIAKSLKGSNEFKFRVKGFISDEEPMIGKNILGEIGRAHV